MRTYVQVNEGNIMTGHTRTHTHTRALSPLPTLSCLPSTCLPFFLKPVVKLAGHLFALPTCLSIQEAFSE